MVTFLLPTNTNGALNDQALHRFLQQLVTNVTGLPGSVVRQRWLPEPGNLPTFGVDWAAVGILTRRRDTFAYVQHVELEAGEEDIVYRNELLDCICTFYGPNAENNGEIFAMGLQVAQNRESLQLSGFGLVSVDDATTLPELIHERWTYRIDVPFVLRRAQQYQYDVPSLIGASGVIAVELFTDNFTVNFTTASTLPLFAWDITSSTVAGWDAGHW